MYNYHTTENTCGVRNRNNMHTFCVYVIINYDFHNDIYYYVIYNSITQVFFPRQLSKTQLYREIVQVKCVKKMENTCS